MRNVSTKTGILVPQVGQLWEQSGVINEAVTLLQLESKRRHYALKKKYPGMFLSRWKFIPCQRCQALGLTVTISEKWMHGHLQNHRILQALGEEQTWAAEIAFRQMQAQQQKHGQVSRRGRPKGSGRKADSPALFWPALRMRVGQRRRLAWHVFLGFGPLLVVTKHQARRMVPPTLPHPLRRPQELCQHLAERLLKRKVVVLLDRLLTPVDRQRIRHQFVVKEVIEKSVVYGPTVRFHLFMTKGARS